jgi:hypothetical protein
MGGEAKGSLKLELQPLKMKVDETAPHKATDFKENLLIPISGS